MSSSEKGLSVIVPAYNEVTNIRPLCERLFKALESAGIKPAELLIMDDESKGSDETEKIVKELKTKGFEIRGHFRKKSEGKGLSSAVLLGFDMAKYPYILCMDADLQHEPESVPALAEPVIRGDAEFTVGSRNVAGGGVGFEWKLHRRIISWGATSLAYGVAKSTDPMSGFFCTSKKVLARGRKQINPIGWKIGLECAARCRADPLQDIPITFRDREEGESKLTFQQNVEYVRQLGALYLDRYGAGQILAVLSILFLLAIMMLYFFVSAALNAIR